MPRFKGVHSFPVKTQYLNALYLTLFVSSAGGHRIESGWTIPDRSGKKVRSTSYQTGLVRR